MKPWEIDEIRRAVKGKWLMRPEAGTGPRFNGRVCTDSRKAAAGDLFIAIKGERFDAHDFIGEVVKRKVAAALIHTEPSAEILALAKEHSASLILVEETIAALNRLAGAYRANELGGGFRAKVIAVGGSNGKTTTKRIIHTLLAEKYGEAGGIASPASFNNNIGMPLTLLDVSPAHEYVVLEIGTNAPGEIAALGEVCKPDVALITSIGLEHLEKLVDLAGVAREEASIARHLAPGGMLILPADVSELADALKGSKVRRLLIGRESASESNTDMLSGHAVRTSENRESARAAEHGTRDVPDFLLTAARPGMTGTTFSINGRGSFTIPLLGEHNAMNALMAIAVARRFGVSEEQIAAGLAKVRPVEGRMETMHIGSWTVIHDAYNANPTSVAAALSTFARMSVDEGESPGFPSGAPLRKVVVLADMLELGTASEAMHRDVGAAVAALKFALFVAIGPAMRYAADAAEAGGARVVRFAETAAARAGIVRLLKPADAILLKGSHGMRLETLLDALRSGIDTPVAAGLAAEPVA